MKQRLIAAALSIGLIGTTFSAPARANDELGEGHSIKHVLLISVDGLHALDVSNYVASHPNSAMAELAGHGVTYSNARTHALVVRLFSWPSGSRYRRFSHQPRAVLRRQFQSQRVRSYKHELLGATR